MRKHTVLTVFVLIFSLIIGIQVVTTQVMANSIAADVDIDPDTLNLKSKGKWITAYIELPEGYDVNDINVTMILLNDFIPAELHPTEIGDYDTNGILDLMVKFDRTRVISLLILHMSPHVKQKVSLTLTGNLNDGTPFSGSDTINVLSM